MINILVVGDSMLDVYHWGTAVRLSPEAPVPVLKINKTEYRAGGAANVAANLAAMGAKVTLRSVVGGDANGNILRKCVQEAGVAGEWSVPGWMTTTKTRGVVGNHHLFRADHDVPDRFSIQDSPSLNVLIGSADLVVFSYYNKGALDSVSAMIEMANNYNIISIVDPKGADWGRYFGASYVTPNRHEMELYSGTDLVDVLDAKAVIETRDREGCVVHQNWSAYGLPGMVVHSIDPTGAGDSFLAQFAVSIGRGLEVIESCRRANVAGAIATTRMGTTIVTKEEVDALYKT
jgi:rfaE bifunctional protein kinase chain/domain